MAEKILSVFIDESGDFGPYDFFKSQTGGYAHCDRREINRGRGIGRKVILALAERGRALGFPCLYVRKIYDYNIASGKCFESAGFQVFEKVEGGESFRLCLT